MKSARLVLACITLVAAPLIAVAAPGDPRLVNGVLEWPRAVTNESFVIVRGDDGVLYYVGLAATRRDGTMTAGARVAVLGIEGRSAHEITAVGFGSGATTEAALAQLQGARPPAAPAAVAPPSAPPVASPVAAPPVPPAPPVAAPVAAPPAAPGPPPAPAVPATVSPKPAAPAPAPTAQAAPPVAAAPAPVGSATPPAPASGNGAAAVVAPTPVAMPPAVVPTAATSPKAAVAPPPIASAPMLPVDDRRWTEVSGEIEAFVGRTVVLKVDGGRVTVDVSSLSGNLERMVGPGSKVKFYGVPVELRFKAMGFIDPDARGRAR